MSKYKNKLTPTQRKAAMMMVLKDLSDLEEDKKTNEEIAQELGITRRTLQNWLNKPEFLRYMDELAMEFIQGKMAQVSKQLFKLINAKQPSIKAIDLYFRLLGKLQDKYEFTVKKDGVEKPSIDVDHELSELKKLLDK